MTLYDAGKELLLPGNEEKYVIKVGTTMVLPNRSSLPIPVDFIGKTLEVLRLHFTALNLYRHRVRLSEDEGEQILFFKGTYVLDDSYVLQENDNITVKVNENHCNESAASQPKYKFDANNLQIEDYKAACLQHPTGFSLPIPGYLIGRTIAELKSHLTKPHGEDTKPLSGDDLLRLKIYADNGDENTVSDDMVLGRCMQLFVLFAQPEEHQVVESDSLEGIDRLKFQPSYSSSLNAKNYQDKLLRVKMSGGELYREFRISRLDKNVADVLYRLHNENGNLFHLQGMPGDHNLKCSFSIDRYAVYCMAADTEEGVPLVRLDLQTRHDLTSVEGTLYVELVASAGDHARSEEKFLQSIKPFFPARLPVTTVARRSCSCCVVVSLSLLAFVISYVLSTFHNVSCPVLNNGTIISGNKYGIWNNTEFIGNNTNGTRLNLCKVEVGFSNEAGQIVGEIFVIYSAICFYCANDKSQKPIAKVSARPYLTEDLELIDASIWQSSGQGKKMCFGDAERCGFVYGS